MDTGLTSPPPDRWIEAKLGCGHSSQRRKPALGGVVQAGRTVTGLVDEKWSDGTHLGLSFVGLDETRVPFQDARLHKLGSCVVCVG